MLFQLGQPLLARSDQRMSVRVDVPRKLVGAVVRAGAQAVLNEISLVTGAECAARAGEDLARSALRSNSIATCRHGHLLIGLEVRREVDRHSAVLERHDADQWR